MNLFYSLVIQFVVFIPLALTAEAGPGKAVKLSRVDAESVLIEGKCIRSSGADYVYPGRRCYTRVELDYDWDQLEEGTDSEIYQVSTQLRLEKLKEKALEVLKSSRRKDSGPFSNSL